MAEGLVLYEQRQLVRKELIYYLKITDRQTGAELGRLGDLHSQGMLVLSEKPLAVEKQYSISLELPKALQTSRQNSLDFECEALWTRPGPKNNTYHESGVRFLSVGDRELEMIAKLTGLFAMP